MMSRNKLKNCYRNEISDYTKQIVKGIDWYDLRKGEDYEIDSSKINSKLNMNDINYASEAQGIKLMLGKSYEEQWIDNNVTNKNQYIDYIKKCIDDGKLVIVATGNKEAGKLKESNHVFYVSSIDTDKKEITTIDSKSGEITTSFEEFLNNIAQIHVTDFPDIEKTIEQEIDIKKIQEIEREGTDIKNSDIKSNSNNDGDKDPSEEVNIKGDSEYLQLILDNKINQIKLSSIKSINDLFVSNISSDKIKDLILNNSEAFADSAFAGFDLDNGDNKTKLGLTSTTPKSGRKRRVFLAVLLYVCFGLGYFTGWSKKLLDAADSIEQHNSYLAKLNNLIKAKNKSVPLLSNAGKITDVDRDKNTEAKEQNGQGNKSLLQQVKKETSKTIVTTENITNRSIVTTENITNRSDEQGELG